MAALEWNEWTVTALLALCVLLPVCVFVLTQKLFESPDDIAAVHFDFDATGGPSAKAAPPSTAAGSESPAGGCGH